MKCGFKKGKMGLKAHLEEIIKRGGIKIL